MFTRRPRPTLHRGIGERTPAVHRGRPVLGASGVDGLPVC
jgi:hypothetical protein